MPPLFDPALKNEEYNSHEQDYPSAVGDLGPAVGRPVLPPAQHSQDDAHQGEDHGGQSQAAHHDPKPISGSGEQQGSVQALHVAVVLLYNTQGVYGVLLVVVYSGTLLTKPLTCSRLIVALAQIENGWIYGEVLWYPATFTNPLTSCMFHVWLEQWGSTAYTVPVLIILLEPLKELVDVALADEAHVHRGVLCLSAEEIVYCRAVVYVIVIPDHLHTHTHTSTQPSTDDS